MISLFSLSSNDQSRQYLERIFGVVGTVLQPSGTSGGEATVLGVMFQTLNTTALVVGAILVIYTTVVGLLKTAQEGEFLGKQWSSLWVPLRMVLGIMCLFPTGAGYSVIQILVMWVVVQGIGAADTLWTTVLNYVQLFGSPYSGAQIPITAGINQDLQTLFSNLVCANAATGKDINGNPYTDQYPDTSSSDSPPPAKNYYYCTDNPTDAYCTQDKLSVILQDPHNPKYASICSFFTDKNANPVLKCNIGPAFQSGGACGSITMSDYQTVNTQSCPGTDISTAIMCASYYAQSQEVPVIVASMEVIAAQTNQMDNDYIKFYANDSSDTPATAASTVPWIQLHCSTLHLRGTPGVGGSPGCCIYNLQNSLAQFSFLPPQLALWLVQMIRSSDGLPHCSVESDYNPQFPLPYNKGAAGPDYTNMDPGAAVNLVWSCGLAPIVLNQSPTTCVAGTSSTSPANFIQTSLDNYTNFINLQVATAMAQWIAAHPQPLSGWLGDAQAAGWIQAGGYYYQMAKQNSANLQAAIPTLSVSGGDPSTIPGDAMARYRNNYSASKKIVTEITGGSTQDATTPEALKSMTNFSSTAGLGLGTMFMNNMSSGSDPLASMQQEGEGLIIGAYVIYFTSLTVMTVLAIVSSINFIGLGTGIGSNPAVAGVMFASTWLMGLIMAFAAWSISFGGMLAIYMPLVPYTIFTFSAVGWFLAVIEAMVASPFVALGILSPGGQHEILGRAEPALMLIFNVFLRPTLMIMGMMCAMLLASVVCSLINNTFVGVMTSVSGATLGPIEAMIYISAYSSMVMAALNKVFGLIYMLPERVLTWIGGQAVSYGEGEMVAQVKGAAEQMASGLAGGMKSGVDAGVSSLEKIEKKRQDEKKPKGGASATATDEKPKDK